MSRPPIEGLLVMVEQDLSIPCLTVKELAEYCLELERREKKYQQEIEFLRKNLRKDFQHEPET